VKQRRLGQNGPMVGEVGLGAMSFGGIFGATDTATSHRALDKALDVGMTHIDTALIYGPYTSETVIGEYLVKNPTTRQRFSIATKGGVNPNPRKIDNTAGFLRECLEGSLKRLGVERVDLYYIHRRDHSIPIEDVMGTMAEFVREGKIGGIGLSEISPATLERASKVHAVAAVQNEYSLWSRLPELGMTQLCQKLGTTLVAFSPVGRGMFSDVGVDIAKIPASDFRKGIPRFQEPNFSFNMQRVEKFKVFAKARGWTTASLAIAWVLAQGEYILPIPGTRSAEHLADNAAASAIKLTAQDLKAIEEILPLGSANGNRYSHEQQGAAEQYC
jgi:aryl-alcohol dehydrogenase-like predicted oxidoreductase